MLKHTKLGRLSGRQWIILGCLLIAAIVLLGAVSSRRGAILTGDSKVYLSVAKSWRLNHALETTVYNPDKLVIEHAVLTHYPPLVPIIWGSLMKMGLGPGTAVVVSNLIMWFFFLIFIFLMTSILTQCGWASLMATALASVTTNLFYLYLHAWSEPVFLPLLLGCMFAAAIYPRATSSVPVKHLSLLGIFLALSSLARYSAVTVFAAIFVWFLWLRLPQRQVRLLFWEIVGLVLSAMPLAIWIARNRWWMGSPLGGGHRIEGFSIRDFISGVVAVFTSSIGGVMPPLLDWGFLRQARNSLSSPILIVVALAVVAPALVFLLRYTRLSLEAVRMHVKTFPKARYAPLILFLMSYLALYVFAQPFLNFCPMDWRYYSSVLAVAQPLSALILVRVVQRWPQYERWVQAGLAVYIALFLISVPVQWHNLSTRYIRTHTLERVYPETWKYLRQNLEVDDVVIVAPSTEVAFVPALYQPTGWLTRWVNSPGKCEPPQSGRAWIVLLKGVVEPDLKTELEHECPELAQHELSDGIVYEISR